MQERRNSSALAVELYLSCPNTSIWGHYWPLQKWRKQTNIFLISDDKCFHWNVWSVSALLLYLSLLYHGLQIHEAIVNTLCHLVTPIGLCDKGILCILFSVSIHKFWTHKKHVTIDTYHVSFVTLFLWVQNLICALPLLSYDSDVGNTTLYIYVHMMIGFN